MTGQFGPWLNSDPILFGPSQFGPSALVNSDPTSGQFGPFCNGQFRTHQTFFFGQFGPFSLVNSDLPVVNSDLFNWPIRTFIKGQFGPY